MRSEPLPENILIEEGKEGEERGERGREKERNGKWRVAKRGGGGGGRGGDDVYFLVLLLAYVNPPANELISSFFPSLAIFLHVTSGKGRERNGHLISTTLFSATIISNSSSGSKISGGPTYR